MHTEIEITVLIERVSYLTEKLEQKLSRLLLLSHILKDIFKQQCFNLKINLSDILKLSILKPRRLSPSHF